MRTSILLLLALGLAGCDRQKPAEPQAEPVAAAAAPETPASVDRSQAGQTAPAVPFARGDGAPATLAAFRGKPLLVNLWATWCAPCLKEMPMLDALAVREAGQLQVAVVSQDMQGAEVVTPYFAKMKFRSLAPYLDTRNVLMTALEQDGLPLTVLYDAQGREVWRISGPMDWTGAEAAKLIAEGTA